MLNEVGELVGRAIEISAKKWGITPKKIKEDVVSEFSKTWEMCDSLLVEIDGESMIQKFGELERDADVVADLFGNLILHGIMTILASAKDKSMQSWLGNQCNCDKVMEEYIKGGDKRLFRVYIIDRKLVKSFYYFALQLALKATHHHVIPTIK